MFAELLEHTGLIGLLFFFSVFVVIAFWALKPSNKKTIESYKYIPLSEDARD
jgi:cbb3-type cytochrome oxidase subunit 3